VSALTNLSDNNHYHSRNTHSDLIWISKNPIPTQKNQTFGTLIWFMLRTK
jgi:mRNA degradation ribonuclease J1/J2